jgi:hypothetical protein
MRTLGWKVEAMLLDAGADVAADRSLAIHLGLAISGAYFHKRRLRHVWEGTGVP